jgi:ABC-type uncharacterized transport system substrate-binding protein
MSKISRLAGVATFTILTAQAQAHPHLMAEAILQVSVAADGKSIEKLKHVWRFDDVSSSTFLIDLDLNGDLVLDADELKSGGQIMLESMAEFNYFQLVTHDGKDVAMSPPAEIFPSWENNELVVTFEAAPKAALPVSGKVSIGVYDPTFFVAIEFVNDESMNFSGIPTGCAKQVVRPDPEEAIAQNQDTLTDAFTDDPAGNDMGKIFATRLELTCQAG